MMTIIPLLYGIGLTWGCAIPKQHHPDDPGHSMYKDIQLYIFITASIIFFCLGIGFIIAGKWLLLEIRSVNEDLEIKLK